LYENYQYNVRAACLLLPEKSGRVAGDERRSSATKKRSNFEIAAYIGLKPHNISRTTAADCLIARAAEHESLEKILVVPRVTKTTNYNLKMAVSESFIKTR
jgi:hypothetical protein